MPHAAIGEFLLEAIACVLDALARGLDVVDADARVAEAAVRLDIAVVDLVVGIIFGAVVVGEFDEALTVEDAVPAGDGFGRVVAEEVEVELGFSKLELLEKLHAEEFIELDWEG
jgi:hypothetical protein